MSGEHNAEVVKDLSRHLQQEIGVVVQRQLTIAQRVIDTTDVAMLFVGVAVSTAISAAATVAATVDEARSDEMFDWTLDQIARLAAQERERSLEKVREKRRAEA